MGSVIARSGTAGSLSWAAAGRPLAGEVQSGDEALVLDRGADVLVAMVDGLGHGPEAAAAARAACEVLRSTGGDLELLFHACHRAQAHQRGVAMSAALVDPDGAMSWAGVGNVEGLVVTPAGHERLLMRGGVVGGSMPPLRLGHLALQPGDTLVLATDGVSEDFAQSCDPRLPEALAPLLLGRYALPGDDALVLVARWGGRR